MVFLLLRGGKCLYTGEGASEFLLGLWKVGEGIVIRECILLSCWKAHRKGPFVCIELQSLVLYAGRYTEGSECSIKE
jgi:hypothetical protein